MADERSAPGERLHQANDSDSMLAMHRTIGSLGMALHADPQSVLIVGLGGGATARAVARFGEGTVRTASFIRTRAARGLGL